LRYATNGRAAHNRDSIMQPLPPKTTAVGEHVLPPFCILAGGRGTRLGDLTAAVPKPLVEVAGRPFIEHVLHAIARAGAQRVVLSIGYLANQFQATLGNGSRFGLELIFVEDGDTAAGTAGGIRKCLPLLGDQFLVLYGDTYLDVDYVSVANQHARSGLPGLMAVLQNFNATEKSNCVVCGDMVISYDKQSPPRQATWIDYGLLAFSAEAFYESREMDLSDVQRRLAASRQLGAYVAVQPFHDIGTPEALRQTEQFLLSELLSKADVQKLPNKKE
jgi:NDP-sugar pyrophosphorylase family protein